MIMTQSEVMNAFRERMKELENDLKDHLQKINERNSIDER